MTHPFHLPLAALALALAPGLALAQSAPLPECGAVNYTGGEVGCTCPSGGSEGAVWGSGPYTTDSHICTAARHSGAIGPEGGAVRLTAQPGQDSYPGSTANGITTSDWGPYGKSFQVTALTVETAQCSTIPEGVDAHTCTCPADTAALSVWGSDPYTADSDICTAARHASYIDASGGEVHVLRIQGLPAYAGSAENGVETSEWGAYGESIVFDWNR